MKLCTVEGCKNRHLAKGLCASHYNTQRMARLREEQRAKVRTCQHCGDEFSGRSPAAIFCSFECKEAAHGKRRVYASRSHPQPSENACQECGGSLGGRRPTAKYCSRQCWARAKARADRKAINQNRVCVVCKAPMPEDASLSRKYCSGGCLLAQQRARIYGITAQEYEALLKAQGGVCAICGSDQWGPKGPHIDHCHTNGGVRALLCAPCNVGLGNFRDNPAFLRAAATFLESRSGDRFRA